MQGLPVEIGRLVALEELDLRVATPRGMRKIRVPDELALLPKLRKVRVTRYSHRAERVTSILHFSEVEIDEEPQYSGDEEEEI